MVGGTMTERVAKAIGDCLYGYVDPNDTPNIWASSVSAAEEALKAMREPTAAMLAVGPPEPYMDADVWANMVDAALSGPT